MVRVCERLEVAHYIEISEHRPTDEHVYAPISSIPALSADPKISYPQINCELLGRTIC